MDKDKLLEAHGIVDEAIDQYRVLNADEMKELHDILTDLVKAADVSN